MCWPCGSLACDFGSWTANVGPPGAGEAFIASLPSRSCPARSDHHEWHPAQAFRRKAGAARPRGGAPGARGEAADGARSREILVAVMTGVNFCSALDGWIRGAWPRLFRTPRCAFPGCSTSAQTGFRNPAPGPVRVMGEVYYLAPIWSQTPPRRICSSVGEEELTGQRLTREVYTRLKRARWLLSQRRRRGSVFPAPWSPS